MISTQVTRERDVTRLFARSKRCDLLFNNAGVNVPPTSVEDMSLSKWRWVVGTNLDAAFHVAREAFKLMTTHGGGRIVNNGSVSAAAPRPGSVAYTASKHAVTGLTKSLALDGRPFDIAAGQIDFGNVVSASAEINQCVRPAWRYYLLFWPPRRSARVLGVLARGVLGLLTRTFDFRTVKYFWAWLRHCVVERVPTAACVEILDGAFATTPRQRDRLLDTG